MKEYGVRRDPLYRLHDSEVICKGRVVSVSRQRIRLPNGHETTQDVIHLESAVAVVPLLSAGNGDRSVVLVEQFRNSVQGHIHEIPAGLVEPGEDPETCARRELEEETGFRAESLRHMTSLLMIPGTSEFRLHFFLAQGLSPGVQNLDGAECLRVLKMPFEPLVKRLVAEAPGSTVVVDAKTHLGLLHAWMLLRGPGEEALP